MDLHKNVILFLLACIGLAFGTKKLQGETKSGSVLMCHIWLYFMNLGSVNPGPIMTPAFCFVTLKFRIVMLLQKWPWFS